MQPVDLTQPWTDNCPSWPTSPNPKAFYIKRIHDEGVNSMILEIPTHTGTHMDSERHFVETGRAIGEFPIDELVTDGVIVDVSDTVDDYGRFGRDEILDQPVDVRPGDALIVHTGHHKYAYDQPTANLDRYFYKHPGPTVEFADWCLEMEFAWLGIDGSSMDHPMNGMLRGYRDDIDREANEALELEEVYPEETRMVMHKKLFPEGIVHVENVGGDIDDVLNERVTLGCFPLRMMNVEASPCRLVAFRQ